VLDAANYSDQVNDRTAASGEFNVSVDGNSTYAFTYHQYDETNNTFADDDGTADVYSFEYTFLRGNTDVGNHTIPAGHDVNITVVNESGVPVSNARVTIYSKARERPTFGVNVFTNADGMVDPNAADPPGVELAGNVTIDVSPPSGNDSFNDTTIRKSLRVTSDRSLTVMLEENDTDADVHGVVLENDSTAAVDDRVRVISTTTTIDQDEAITATDGGFHAELAGNSSYTFTFHQYDDGNFSERDGTADVYAFESRSIGGDTDVGSYTMPTGHTVNITVVDESGQPVEDAKVTITSKRRSLPSSFGWAGFTAANGMVDPNPASPPGVELNGNVTVDVEPPAGSTRFDVRRVRESLTVTGNRSVTVTLQESGPSNTTTRWRHDVGTGLQYSRIATGDRLVYAGGLGESVYALYRTNGTVAWRFNRSGSLVDSSPLLAEGTLYVGSGGGLVYALDAASGSVEWSYATDSAVVSSPTLHDGTLYVGSNDGTVMALNATAGGVVWTHETGGAVYSQPEVASGTLVATTDAGQLFALDTATGTEQWSLDTGTELGHAGATVVNGTVVVAADDVYATDLATGTVQWTTTFGGTAGASPAAHDGTVYVGAENGTVSALNASTGAVVWRFGADAPVAATPAVGEDRVVVATTNGTLSVLNATTGTLVNETYADSAIRTQPSLAGDNAYLGTQNGTVMAVANVATPPVSSTTTNSTTSDDTTSDDTTSDDTTSDDTTSDDTTSDDTTSDDTTPAGDRSGDGGEAADDTTEPTTEYDSTADGTTTPTPTGASAERETATPDSTTTSTSTALAETGAQSPTEEPATVTRTVEPQTDERPGTEQVTTATSAASTDGVARVLAVTTPGFTLLVALVGLLGGLAVVRRRTGR
jgi:outer membrane protein assembly factor BamB